MRALALSFLTACAPFSSSPAGDGGAEASSSGGEGGLLGDAGSGDGASPLAKSCKELLAAGQTTSGRYTVAPQGVAFDVYCDMQMAGGGWTLVARTANGGNVRRFGWRIATGALGDDDAPYALDATTLAPFTEILFGARGGAKSWASPVYARALPPELLTAAALADGLAPSAGSKAFVGCAGLQGPEPIMLSRVGKTRTADHFVFTDSDATPNFGLHPDGWDTNRQGGTEDCAYDGALTGKPGMIFVR